MSGDNVRNEYQKYMTAIGRIAAGSASLEEVVLFGMLSLTKGSDPHELHLKLMHESLNKNIDGLKKIAKQRLKGKQQDSIIKLLDKAHQLRVTRNETIHGNWFVWADGETLEPVSIGFSRYSKNKKTKKLEWTPHLVPKLKDLEKLGVDLNDCKEKLSTALKDAYEKLLFSGV